ncbi:MAG: hydroxymethylpyrimidine/phosphomethylpyrimidine kinase [Proteobacteria bacterium]|nr:hydroxymethylpyrimidine/phosphomethylpyrimidine kinase [Pseudomonadota bacterium]
MEGRDHSPRCVLSIAGSDPSGGAGIQADLKTFAAHGVYGMAAITALTAQNTHRVRWVQPVGPGGVRVQVRAILEDLPVHAVKIGMLGDASVATAVAHELMDVDVPIVLDPVLGSSTGSPLNEAPEALKHLVPLCALVTPNLDELEALPWLLDAGVPLLVTGGHGTGELLVERLVLSTGERTFEHPRVETRNLHGTGCTLSSAIAARLALGQPLEQAVEGAIAWVHERIERSACHDLGAGSGPLLHQDSTEI